MVSGPVTADDTHARWDSLQVVFPFFVAAAKQFRHESPPFETLTADERELIGRAYQWLERVDKQIAPHEFRKLLHSKPFNRAELTLALIALYLEKRERTGADRDKLDYLLAQYLRVRGEAEAQQGNIEMDRAAQLLEPVLGESPTVLPPWLEPLERLVHDLRRCGSLRELDASEIIQRGRTIKVEAREMYFGRSSLVAFARFNFVVGCTFRRLLQADLTAIALLIDDLEARGVMALNCTSISLSDAEPLSALRDMCHNWQQPSYQNYTDLSFQRIVRLRQVLEAKLASTPPTTESRLRFLELRLEAMNAELAELRRQAGRHS